MPRCPSPHRIIRTSAVAASSWRTRSTRSAFEWLDDSALDIGASTGGFTDVLLQRGAARVVALDVGHGQLDWKIRSDPRVDVIERKNARTLTLADLPPGPRTVSTSSRSTCRSSRSAYSSRCAAASRRAARDVIALVKPQFEAGRAEVGKGGIVRDPAVHARVLEEVAAAADALGLRRAGTTESPIAGMEGNREFLLHLRRDVVPDMPITRVGLVAKNGLDAAAGALAELAGWLEARDVHAVFETETAALAGLPPGRRTVDRDELPLRLRSDRRARRRRHADRHGRSDRRSRRRRRRSSA